MTTIPDFEPWYEAQSVLDPPPPPVTTYRIERWVLWVALAVMVSATIASGAHNIPTIQSTLPSDWPVELQWFVALAGFVAFDVGLFLSAYFLFFFRYRKNAQEKINDFVKQIEADPDNAVMETPVDNYWVLIIGAFLTIVYTVIANISAAGNELLGTVPEWMDTVTVLGMGVIPLWAFFSGENVARTRAFNSVADERDAALSKAARKAHRDKYAAKYRRLVGKATKQAPVQVRSNERSDEQTVNTGGSLNANLNTNERAELFRRAWAEHPEQFNGMSVRDIAQQYEVSVGTVSNVRNGK